MIGGSGVGDKLKIRAPIQLGIELFRFYFRLNHLCTPSEENRSGCDQVSRQSSEQWLCTGQPICNISSHFVLMN